MNIDKRHDIEECSFTSSSKEGAHIYYKHYLPIQKLPKSIIHVYIQHGVIEYADRHQELIDALRDHFGKKVVITSMDLIGHGLSGGHRAYVDHFDVFINDLYKLFNLSHERFHTDHNVETYILAHSLGGLIAIKSLSNEKRVIPFDIKGLILTNPCIKAKLDLPLQSVGLLDKVPEILSKVRVPVIYDAYDLTQDNEKAISFIHDHLISKSITIRLGIEIYKATLNINTTSYFFDVPTYFILSGDDRVVDNDKTELYITGMKKSLVKVKRYPKMRHDILNETCRTDVFKEIIKHIENRRK